MLVHRMYVKFGCGSTYDTYVYRYPRCRPNTRSITVNWLICTTHMITSSRNGQSNQGYVIARPHALCPAGRATRVKNIGTVATSSYTPLQYCQQEVHSNKSIMTDHHVWQHDHQTSECYWPTTLVDELMGRHYCHKDESQRE